MKDLPLWLPLSFILAQRLVQQKAHEQFLTNVERKYIEDALCSFATWIAFISQHEHSSVEIDTAAFRVRSMLCEEFIPHLFHTNKACCNMVDFTPLIEEARRLDAPSSDDINREWQAFLEIHVKKQASPQLHNAATMNTPDMNHVDVKQEIHAHNEESAQGITHSY